jgi:S-formylglutathione hydrolase FrmB
LEVTPFPFSTKVGTDPGYDPGGTERYPVVYFLHGANYSHTFYWNYFDLGDSLDTVIARGEIEPVIFVMPNGNYGPHGGCYWTNSELYGQWEDFVAIELPDYIDNHYQTLPTRYFRCLQGLSMGGYGSMKILLKHRDRYIGTASHSGPVDFRTAIPLQAPFVLDEYPAGPPYTYYPGAGFWSALFFTRSGAFSPNLANPPHYVDFPLDEWGVVVDSVMARWDLNNPPHLAAQLPPYPWPLERDVAIYFECGSYDEHLELPVNQAFSDSLTALGIPHEFRIFDGGHSNRFKRRFKAGLAYLDSVMHVPMFQDAGHESQAAHQEAALQIEGQNPCWGSASFGFNLPADDWVYLAIYDSQGRLVRRLLESPMSAGQHRCCWTGLDEMGSLVPRGVYFLRLWSERGMSARQTVVMSR